MQLKKHNQTIKSIKLQQEDTRLPKTKTGLLHVLQSFLVSFLSRRFKRGLPITAVSSGCVISPFRLNLTVQTLVGSLSGVIVPIPLHTVNIIHHQFKRGVAYDCLIENLVYRVRL